MLHLLGGNIPHEMNVHHEPVGCIAYDSCISTSYIPMLLLGRRMLETFSRTNRAFGVFRDLVVLNVDGEQVLQLSVDGRSGLLLCSKPYKQVPTHTGRQPPRSRLC
jgi:hypothetical protein